MGCHVTVEELIRILSLVRSSGESNQREQARVIGETVDADSVLVHQRDLRAGFYMLHRCRRLAPKRDVRTHV